MTFARDFIQARLVEQLPASYVVERWTPQLDGLEVPTLLLKLGPIQPTAFPGTRTYQAAILAVSPVQGASVDELEEVDQLAEDVMHAIDKAPALTWSSCEPVGVDDAWAGWEVKLTATLQLNAETPSTPG